MYFEFEENGKMCLAKLNFLQGLFALMFGRKICKHIPKSKIVFQK